MAVKASWQVGRGVKSWSLQCRGPVPGPLFQGVELKGGVIPAILMAEIAKLSPRSEMSRESSTPSVWLVFAFPCQWLNPRPPKLENIKAGSNDVTTAAEEPEIVGRSSSQQCGIQEAEPLGSVDCGLIGGLAPLAASRASSGWFDAFGDAGHEVLEKCCVAAPGREIAPLRLRVRGAAARPNGGSWPAILHRRNSVQLFGAL